MEVLVESAKDVAPATVKKFVTVFRDVMETDTKSNFVMKLVINQTTKTYYPSLHIGKYLFAREGSKYMIALNEQEVVWVHEMLDTIIDVLDGHDSCDEEDLKENGTTLKKGDREIQIKMAEFRGHRQVVFFQRNVFDGVTTEKELDLSVRLAREVRKRLSFFITVMQFRKPSETAGVQQNLATILTQLYVAWYANAYEVNNPKPSHKKRAKLIQLNQKFKLAQEDVLKERRLLMEESENLFEIFGFNEDQHRTAWSVEGLKWMVNDDGELIDLNRAKNSHHILSAAVELIMKLTQHDAHKLKAIVEARKEG